MLSKDTDYFLRKAFPDHSVSRAPLPFLAPHPTRPRQPLPADRPSLWSCCLLLTALLKFCFLYPSACPCPLWGACRQSLLGSGPSEPSHRVADHRMQGPQGQDTKLPFPSLPFSLHFSHLCCALFAEGYLHVPLTSENKQQSPRSLKRSPNPSSNS